MNPTPHEVTQLFTDWSGHQSAFSELLPLVGSEEGAAELIALDEALQELTRGAPRSGRVVKLRYFGGLSVQETADVLKVHPNTVLNDWREAKTWPYSVLSESEA